MPEILEIEVKYAINPDQGVEAVEKLTGGKLPDSVFEVWFFDDAERSLLAKGLILRARIHPNQPAKCDSTFKLRTPADAIGAAESLGVGEQEGPPKTERKLEGDWNVNGSKKVSYSATIQPPAIVLEDVLAGKYPLQGLFLGDVAAAVTGVQWENLLAYGPIPAKKWKLALDMQNGKVSVEWWDAGGKILVEVSDKKEPTKAAKLEKAIEQAMGKLGLEQLPASKTEFALAHVSSREIG